MDINTGAGNDILTCGEYEIHPDAHPVTGKSTGWYTVVKPETGEALSRHETLAEAKRVAAQN